MKTYSWHAFGFTWLLVLYTFLACVFLLARPNYARAASNDANFVDRAETPTPTLERLRKERPKGALFVAIPRAYVFGIGGGNASYCSPSIRVTNSTNAAVEELIVGIDYLTEAGKPAGATVSRYSNVKIRSEVTHFFYQLTGSECKGLAGQVSIVRCVYSTGEDCSSEVQAIGFGTIPLRLQSR